MYAIFWTHLYFQNLLDKFTADFWLFWSVLHIIWTQVSGFSWNLHYYWHSQCYLQAKIKIIFIVQKTTTKFYRNQVWTETPDESRHPAKCLYRLYKHSSCLTTCCNIRPLKERKSYLLLTFMFQHYNCKTSNKIITKWCEETLHKPSNVFF